MHRQRSKYVARVDVLRRYVLTQVARRGLFDDCATLRALVGAHEAMLIGLVIVDAEFDSERNPRHVREVIGADSVVTVKRGKADRKIKGTRAQMRRRFPCGYYG